MLKYGFVIALLFFSCTEKGKLYDQMSDIPTKGWNYNQIPEFPVMINNSGITYNVYLKLRIQKSYPYENLYLLSHIRNPDGKILTQKKDFVLTNDMGKPLGVISGDVIDYEIPMYENLKLDGVGQYIFALEQNLRDSVVNGVQSIGIKVKEGIPVF
jgi:gliding motility-associated lipoprotein GldH